MTFIARLNDKLIDFIGRQKMFFTATAPAEGRINLSPKGMDAFRVLDPATVAYLDVTGSGNEASAHLKQNGRMTIMMCSFEGAPMILRLYGHGEVVRPRDARWAELHANFDAIPGERQIIVLKIDSIQTSCGYAVPEFEFKTQRQMLRKWSEVKGPEGIQEYWAENNQKSIDGLPSGILED